MSLNIISQLHSLSDHEKREVLYTLLKEDLVKGSENLLRHSVKECGECGVKIFIHNESTFSYLDCESKKCQVWVCDPDRCAPKADFHDQQINVLRCEKCSEHFKDVYVKLENIVECVLCNHPIYNPDGNTTPRCARCGRSWCSMCDYIADHNCDIYY